METTGHPLREFHYCRYQNEAASTGFVIDAERASSTQKAANTLLVVL